MTDWTLYLVTDPDLAGGPDNVPHIVSQAISGGVSVVQLRDKRATRGEIRQHAQALCEVTGNIPLFINDYVDIAAELGLHAHIGQSDTRYVEARKLLPDHLMLGLSIETHEQLITVIADAQEAGVRLPDVIGIGPVRATSTKPDHAAPLGVEGVAAIARTAVCYGIATVAIGGVDKQCASKLQAVDGACVVSAIMAAQDPHAAARELRGAFVQVPRVLSIAGTDPTGGAGAQADVKSITAAGGYGMNVVTALVAQNTHGVRSVHTPPLEFLDEQLDAVFSDVAVDAIKIGMLATVDTIATVQAWLDMYPSPVVVLDPVMIATSGDRLIDADAEQALRQLARRVDVITPNIPELAVLVGEQPASTFAEAVEQARYFNRGTATTVIVKGGHLTGTEVENAVVEPDGNVTVVRAPRVETMNTHGTGCSLSSALTTRIAAGDTVAEALQWSVEWLHEAIAHGADLRVGQPGGHGPVDHGYRARQVL